MRHIQGKLFIIFMLFTAGLIGMGRIYLSSEEKQTYREQEGMLHRNSAGGVEGIAERLDYRGEKVIGYLATVPGFNWCMVSKVDKEEIINPGRRYFRIYLLASALLISVNLILLILLIRDQRLKLYRSRLQNEIERKETAENLVKSEELFRKLFENMLNGFAYCKMICEKDHPVDFIYINVNEAFEVQTGLKDVTGKKVSEVIPDFKKRDNTLIETYGRVATTGNPETFEYFVESMNMWFSIAVYSPKKEYFVAIFDVITERKKSENTILKLNMELEDRVTQRTAQLEASNKELEAFSYSVSHDLRAPIRSIHSFTNILIEDYGHLLDEEGKRICSVISSSGKKMGELIDDLLNFSRIGRSSLDIVSLDMQSMAASVFSELTTDEEKARINFKIEKLKNASGDPKLIRIVLNNLISNAIKYSSKEKYPEILIGSTSYNGTVEYFIKDNGVGFEMKYINKLFGVFQRLHNEKEFEGNGVGLAIVNRIILNHRGTARAEGEIGNGATFFFTLQSELKSESLNTGASGLNVST